MFDQFGRHVAKGDVDTAWSTGEYCIEGECRSGSQEHLYMETNQALVVPKREQNEYDVYVSAQGTTDIQVL